MSKSDDKAAEAAALLRARSSIWVVTTEEARVEGYLFEAAAAAGYATRYWDVAAGVTDAAGNPDLSVDGAGDPEAILTAIRERTGDRCVWVMRDLAGWLQPPIGMVALRRLRNLVRWMPRQPSENGQAVIVISPSKEVPAELVNHFTVIEWPLPDREEIAELLDVTVNSLKEKHRAGAVNGSRDAVIDAAVGLTGEEAQACFSKSLVSTQPPHIDPALVAAEKQRVIARDGILEWVDPPEGGLDNIGGLDNWKAWLQARAAAFTPEARAYGLPSPKGALVVGVPGCGKSYSAKALASEWRVPLIRFDLGAMRSKFVGESEGNLRKALAIVEAVGRCVVWLDEIEKALAGATGEAGDGGVSADALGAILSWMQDRKGEAFVIATANNAEKLPPELLRKGRFDEVWWVDLPFPAEREAIVAAALNAHGRDCEGVDIAAVADATDTFTGAEIAALVPDALFEAFADNARQVNTDDLLRAAKTVVPLAKTADAKIKALREFWSGRARPATKGDVKLQATINTGARALDL